MYVVKKSSVDVIGGPIVQCKKSVKYTIFHAKASNMVKSYGPQLVRKSTVNQFLQIKIYFIHDKAHIKFAQRLDHT